METYRPIKRARLRIAFILIGLVLLFKGWYIYQLIGPSPKIVVSRETTFITTPLADDGLPDFQAYLLEQASEGITPDNNAAVLLWQALWPHNLEPEHRSLMREALGMKDLPNEEESLVLLDSDKVQVRVALWLSNSLEKPEDWTEADWQDYLRFELAERVVDDAARRPWTTEQIPVLAGWIAENQKPLDTIVEASKRTAYFSPSPNHLDGSHEGLIASLLPMTQNLRNASSALSVRAMWHLGEGRPERAWQDTHAAFKCAQFSSQGWALVQQLICHAIQYQILHQTVAILSSRHTTEELAKEILRDLQALPPTTHIADILNHGERLSIIDSVLNFSRGGFHPIEESPMNVFKHVSIDWNVVLGEINDFYNELVETCRMPNRVLRIEASTSKIEELTSRVDDISAQKAKLWANVVFSRRNRSKAIADIYMAYLTPAIDVVFNAKDRLDTRLEMTVLSAALAVYYSQHDEYPEQLSALVPDIIEELPLDLFSNQPFVYKRKDDGGYLLYSLFENCEDDNGTDFQGWIIDGEWVDQIPDDFEHDYFSGDLVIRVPFPEFKLPDPEFSNESW